MRFIDMPDYSRAARAYWWVAATAGSAAFAWAIEGILALSEAEQLKTGLLLAVVIVAGLRPVPVPGTQVSITAGDTFVFLAAVLLGAPAATLVATTDAFVASYRTSSRWTSWFGGPAMVAVAVFVSANFFELMLTWSNNKGESSATLLAALLAFSVCYFILNSLFVTTLDALKKHSSLFTLWRQNYSWASLTYIASASAAGLIYLGIKNYGASSLLAAGPLVAIIYAASHFYFKQADQSLKASQSMTRLYLATVESLAAAIDAKDQITHDHVYRVQVYSRGLAHQFGLGEPDVEALKVGALLHDVGKIAVPDYILNKPGKLTAAEFEKMKIHTIVGAQILERVGFPYPVVPIVRHHHERWDGRGYPDGLKGEQIPLTARILTVVDCFDALCEDRQYRKAMTREDACQFLRDNAGSQFDPRVVESFLTNLCDYENEISAHIRPHQPLLSPSTQAGLSEGGLNAVPSAGLMMEDLHRAPEYLKQIKAVHAEVAALYEMAQTVSTSLDVRDVVTLTVTRIERMVPFTTCVVYLRAVEEDDCAVAAYVFGEHSREIQGQRIPTGRGIAGWVVLNGRPMVNVDPRLDLDEFDVTEETEYRSAAVFPLVRGNETIGAFAVYTSEPDRYNNNDLSLLESVSTLASTALQHAMLYEQTRTSAETDPLTGLANTRCLYERLERELQNADEHDSPLSILTFDLAGLRAVNETHGYQAGDRLLVEVARRLRRTLDGQGFLSRIAGDEFTCLLSGWQRSQAIVLGERVRTEAGRPRFEITPGKHAHFRLRLGIAEYPTDGRTINDLLHAAGVSARQDKTLGEEPQAVLTSGASNQLDTYLSAEKEAGTLV